MSDDTTPNPEVSDDTEGGQGAPDGEKAKTKDTDFVSKSEADKAFKRRDQAIDRAKAAEKRVEELEAQIKGFDSKLDELGRLQKKGEEDEAAKRGDIEALRKSASDREAELATRIAELTTSLEKTKADAKTEIDSFKGTYLLKNEVMRVLSEVTTDPELVWMALGHHFELSEDEDGYKPRVKDDTRDIKTFVERKLEDSNRAVLLKNSRKQGAGTEPSPAKEKAIVALTRTQIEALPSPEQLDYFRNNPDVLKAYVAGKLQP